MIHEAPSLPYGGNYHGHEGARQHGIGYRRTWDVFQPSARRDLNPIFLETTEVGVYKVRDGKVIESWMFHQDTVALLEFLREAQQQTP